MSTEERLERLEKENRRLRKFMSLAMILIASVVIAGASLQAGSAETIKARTFMVEDESGNIRATLGLDKRNEVFLAFFDANGNSRMAIHQEQHTKAGTAVRETIRRFAIPGSR